MPETGKLAEYYRVDWSGRVVIGNDQFPVSEIETVYKLNEIPYVGLVIPIGTNPKTGETITPKKVLSSAGMTGKINPEIAVYVTATARPSGRDAPKSGGLPQGEFKIFSGYVISPGFTRDVDNVGVRLVGFGDLGGLSSGTSLIDTVISDKGDSGADKMKSALGNQKDKSATLEVLMKRNIPQNLGAGIHQLFKDMANGVFSFTLQKSSANALKALEKLDFNSSTLGIAVGSLDQEGGLAGEALDKAVAKSIASVVFNIWSADLAFQERDADLWTMLKELSRLFEFSIVPTVDKAYFAPIIPNLNEIDHKIDPDEYFSLSLAPFDRRGYGHVTKVGLFAQGSQLSNWEDGTSKTAIIGAASIIDQDAGRLKLVGAPHWILSPAAKAALSVDPTKGVKTAENTEKGENKKDQATIELKFLRAEIGDAYAKTILYSELFKNRIITVRGRVRTDIAPGNQVELVTPGLSFGGGNDGGSDMLYGMVDSVTMRLGSKQAHTELSIVNVRNSGEQKSYTLDLHPIFKHRWKGIRLV